MKEVERQRWRLGHIPTARSTFGQTSARAEGNKRRIVFLCDDGSGCKNLRLTSPREGIRKVPLQENNCDGEPTEMQKWNEPQPTNRHRRWLWWQTQHPQRGNNQFDLGKAGWKCISSNSYCSSSNIQRSEVNCRDGQDILSIDTIWPIKRRTRKRRPRMCKLFGEQFGTLETIETPITKIRSALTQIPS